MGLNTSIMAIGNIAGPLLAGLLIDRGLYAGWAFSFGLIAICALMAILLLIKFKTWPMPDAAFVLAAKAVEPSKEDQHVEKVGT